MEEAKSESIWWEPPLVFRNICSAFKTGNSLDHSVEAGRCLTPLASLMLSVPSSEPGALLSMNPVTTQAFWYFLTSGPQISAHMSLPPGSTPWPTKTRSVPTYETPSDCVWSSEPALPHWTIMACPSVCQSPPLDCEFLKGRGLSWSLFNATFGKVTPLRKKCSKLYKRDGYKHYGVSQVVPVAKKLPANAGDVRNMGSIPGLGRSLGGGHRNSLQHSCLENPMTEEPGGLQSRRLQRVGHNWAHIASKLFWPGKLPTAHTCPHCSYQGAACVLIQQFICIPKIV